MTGYKCKQCGHKDQITWNIIGFGITLLDIHFTCKKCDHQMKLTIFFPNNKNIEKQKELLSQADIG